jgi:hypothetical protein
VEFFRKFLFIKIDSETYATANFLKVTKVLIGEMELQRILYKNFAQLRPYH